ncbi:MAG: bifunctional [glutamate--ammonia ligase]-adenylyl-L-tyrosine phosphorylase/[glutamate--ammonia-ligase] adenylyltransferase [Betaproteobacteria bacterium]|nr:bifunctional [glutamate--ammonia ligase]-adenylyl-L-tyrosine phosphorylase/[glutamate--ammonia-ligase] adenylyltransferase [Betaproteobacteria bacterium]
MRFVSEDYSGYFRRSLAALEAKSADPQSIRRLLGERVSMPVDASAIDALLDAHTDGRPLEADGAHAASVLRRLRQWVMLILMERDLTGRADLDEVCRAMTYLARRTTGCAMRVAGSELAQQFGAALDGEGDPQDLLAVAMGKGGADELNVSSDLDLVFVFRDEGQSAGSASGRIIASSEWMHRAARRTIELLSEITADGFVFRVDTRLRPNGDSGPLVASLSMLEQYFFSQGREWERFAWLKSNVIADTAQAGEQSLRDDTHSLERIVTPFVFRRYLDYDAFASLRDLHRLIRSEVARRSARDLTARDVKLGRGGIREIEFTAQLFQIVRGGRDPGLRDRRTLATLATLARRSVLDREECDTLARAYQLLRRTEHALQFREDEQTHRLSGSADERAHIAAMLRMAPADFDQAITEATQAVANIFERLLAPDPDDRSRAPEEGAGDAAPAADDPDVVRRIGLLREGTRYAAARADTRAAIERLLSEAIAQRTGSAGMIRLVELLESVCRRPAYVALLARYPLVFGRVLRVLDWSKWPAEYLMRHPVVLDELLDGQLLESTDYSDWARQLRERVVAARIGEAPDVELQMDLVREAHHAQVFRLMVQDLEGRHSTERISDFLSELADQVLGLVIDLVWSQLRQRYCDPPRFAAIAYGRLGGKELGYASDLDLVFLYDNDDDRATEAYSVLAQRLGGWLSTRTAAGLLFETDLRLRPNGQAGLLVSTVEAFERYQRESAWVWEHQALSRARFAAGDHDLGERFEQVRRSVLSIARDPKTLAKEVIAMRRKMHDGHPNRSELFDLKHDRGGMVDIEFIVQYLVLAHAKSHPQLLDNAGNIALLGRAAQAGLIDCTLAEEVANAYRRYRQLQHRLRLDDTQFARVATEVVAGQAESVRSLWRQTLETAAGGDG